MFAPVSSIILMALASTVAQFHPNPFGAAVGSMAIHDVDVGKAGFDFDPKVLFAAPGDTINFHFHRGNHSIAESSFDLPCRPRNVESGKYPIFSGFFPTQDTKSTHMFSLQLNGTEPIWLYCSQKEHCQKGQIMVLNPSNDTDQTWENYSNAAKSSEIVVSPHEIRGGQVVREYDSLITNGNDTITKADQKSDASSLLHAKQFTSNIVWIVTVVSIFMLL